MKDSQFSLIIEIQSECVTAAITEGAYSASPKILRYITRPTPRATRKGGLYLTENMLTTLSEVLKEVVHKPLNNHSGRFSKIHCVLSSPWIVSRSKVAHTSYQADTVITKSLINSIVEEEYNTFRTQFNKENTQGEYEFDLELIEQKILDISLNGYSVTDFSGKSARRLDISYALTLSSRHILDKIRSALDMVHGAHVSYHSSLILQYIGLRESIDSMEYVSIHVHGSLTDLVVVKKNNDSSTASSVGCFAYGYTQLIHDLAHRMKITFESAQSTLNLYADGSLGIDEKHRADKYIPPLLASWLKTCGDTLLSMEDGLNVPRQVLLSVTSPSPVSAKLFSKVISDTGKSVQLFTTPLIDIYITALATMI